MRGLVHAPSGQRANAPMKTIYLKTFWSRVLIARLISLNGCVITSAVDHAVTMPVKVATRPL
jgi:hypothetical protein